MPNENLIKLHSNLSKKWEGFSVPLEQFEIDMQDDTKRAKLHKNLTDKWDGFNVSFEQFSVDMGVKKKEPPQSSQPATTGIASSAGAKAKPVAPPRQPSATEAAEVSKIKNTVLKEYENTLNEEINVKHITERLAMDNRFGVDKLMFFNDRTKTYGWSEEDISSANQSMKSNTKTTDKGATVVYKYNGQYYVAPKVRKVNGVTVSYSDEEAKSLAIKNNDGIPANNEQEAANISKDYSMYLSYMDSKKELVKKQQSEIKEPIKVKESILSNYANEIVQQKIAISETERNRLADENNALKAELEQGNLDDDKVKFISDRIEYNNYMANKLFNDALPEYGYYSKVAKDMEIKLKSMEKVGANLPNANPSDRLAYEELKSQMDMLSSKAALYEDIINPKPNIRPDGTNAFDEATWWTAVNIAEPMVNSFANTASGLDYMMKMALHPLLRPNDADITFDYMKTPTLFSLTSDALKSTTTGYSPDEGFIPEVTSNLASITADMMIAYAIGNAKATEPLFSGALPVAETAAKSRLINTFTSVSPHLKSNFGLVMGVHNFADVVNKSMSDASPYSTVKVDLGELSLKTIEGYLSGVAYDKLGVIGANSGKLISDGVGRLFLNTPVKNTMQAITGKVGGFGVEFGTMEVMAGALKGLETGDASIDEEHLPVSLGTLMALKLFGAVTHPKEFKANMFLSAIKSGVTQDVRFNSFAKDLKGITPYEAGMLEATARMKSEELKNDGNSTDAAIMEKTADFYKAVRDAKVLNELSKDEAASKLLLDNVKANDEALNNIFKFNMGIPVLDKMGRPVNVDNRGSLLFNKIKEDYGLQDKKGSEEVTPEPIETKPVEEVKKLTPSDEVGKYFDEGTILDSTEHNTFLDTNAFETEQKRASLAKKVNDEIDRINKSTMSQPAKDSLLSELKTLKESIKKATIGEPTNVPDDFIKENDPKNNPIRKYKGWMVRMGDVYGKLQQRNDGVYYIKDIDTGNNIIVEGGESGKTARELGIEIPKDSFRNEYMQENGDVKLFQRQSVRDRLQAALNEAAPQVKVDAKVEAEPENLTTDVSSPRQALENELLSMVKDGKIKATNKQVKSSMMIYDSIADTWTKVTGKSYDEFWNKFGVKLGTTKEGALQQKGKINVTEQHKNKYRKGGIDDKYDIQAIEHAGMSDVKMDKESITNKIKSTFNTVKKNVDDYTLADGNHIDGLIDAEIAVAKKDGADKATIKGLESAKVNAQARNKYISDYKNAQKETIGRWIEGLEKSDYPIGFKYLIFEAVMTNNYDNGKFIKRTKTTARNFIPFNQKALDELYKSNSDNLIEDYVKIQEYEANKNIIERGFVSKDGDGGWVKYDGNSTENADKNADDLAGLVVNTPWCTKTAARDQLLGGDFYVYVSKDKNSGVFKPRIAIRMNGSSVGEVRGIMANQGIEGTMIDKSTKFLHGLNGGKQWIDANNYNEKVIKFRESVEGRDVTEQDLADFVDISINEKRHKVEYSERNGHVEALEKELFPRLKEKFSAKIAESQDEITDNTEYLFGDYSHRTSLLKKLKLVPDFPKKLKVITGNANLSSLENARGLENLTIIGGTAYFDSLENARGLEKLTIIGGTAYFNSLKNARGLKSLSIIHGVADFPSLKNAQGLEVLTTIDSDAYFDSLENAQGLEKLNTINGGVYFNSLKNAQGLESLTTIRSTADFRFLENARGLESLTTIGGHANFPSLKNARGLESLATIRGIADFGSLKNAQGLENLTIIGDIANFSSLENAQGLESLTTIRGMADFGSLKNAQGLEKLTTIEGMADFYSLEDARGLKSLAIIGDIANFSSLENAQGLEKLNTINGRALFSSLNRAERAKIPALNKLNQTIDGDVKGQVKGSIQFTDTQAIVELFEKADVSTILHEFAGGHMGEVIMRDLAESDPVFKEHYDNVTKWVGKWDTAGKEKFARGWEKYIRTGKAPIKSLQEVFDVLSTALRNIYIKLKGSDIDINIPKEVKKAFDDLLGASTIDVVKPIDVLKNQKLTDEGKLVASVRGGAEEVRGMENLQSLYSDKPRYTNHEGKENSLYKKETRGKREFTVYDIEGIDSEMKSLLDKREKMLQEDKDTDKIDNDIQMLSSFKPGIISQREADAIVDKYKALRADAVEKTRVAKEERASKLKPIKESIITGAKNMNWIQRTVASFSGKKAITKITNFRHYIKTIDGALYEQGKIDKAINDNIIVPAERKFQEINTKYHHKVQEALSDMLGNSYKAQVYKMTADIPDKTGVFYTDKDGNKQELIVSKDAAIKLWMHSQNIDGRATLMSPITEVNGVQRGNGFTEETIAQLEKYIGKKGMALGDKLMDMYTELFEMENKVASSPLVYGIPIRAVEGRYSGQLKRKGYMETISNEVNEYSNPNSAKVPGHHKRRVDSDLALDINDGALSSFESYLRDASNFIAFREAHSELNYVFKDRAVKDSMEKAFGRDFVMQAYNFHIPNLIGSYVSQSGGMDKLAKGFLGGVIPFSMSVAMMQAASTTMLMDKMSFKGSALFLPNMMDFMVRARVKDSVEGMIFEELRNDPWVVDRGLNTILGVEPVRLSAKEQAEFNIVTSKLRKGYRAALATRDFVNSKYGSWLVTNMDKFPIVYGGGVLIRDVYSSLSKEWNKTHSDKIPTTITKEVFDHEVYKQAKLEWYNFMEQNMQSQNRANQAEARIRSDWARTFNMLTSQPYQLMLRMADATGKMAIGLSKGDYQMVGKSLKTMAVVGLSQLVVQLIRDDFKKSDEAEFMFTMNYLASGVPNVSPILQTVGESLYKKEKGLYTEKEQFMIPFQAIEQMAASTHNLSKIIRDETADADDVQDALFDFVTEAGRLTGVNTFQLGRLYEGIVNMKDDNGVKLIRNVSGIDPEKRGTRISNLLIDKQESPLERETEEQYLKRMLILEENLQKNRRKFKTKEDRELYLQQLEGKKLSKADADRIDAQIDNFYETYSKKYKEERGYKYINELKKIDSKKDNVTKAVALALSSEEIRKEGSRFLSSDVNWLSRKAKIILDKGYSRKESVEILKYMEDNNTSSVPNEETIRTILQAL